MTVAELKEYLTAGRHVHLIGIGGVSMFPLAEVLKRAGLWSPGRTSTKTPTWTI